MPMGCQMCRLLWKERKEARPKIYICPSIYPTILSTTRWTTQRDRQTEKKKKKWRAMKNFVKSQQHPEFPSGLLSKYYLGLSLTLSLTLSLSLWLFLSKRKNFSFSVNFYKKVSPVVCAWQERIKTQPIDVDARELLTKHYNEKHLFSVLLSSIHKIR